jgi:preprotein translocase subunit SecB
MTEENNQAPGGEGPQFAILRIYLKDVSFETPNSPAVFMQEWKPEVNLQLNSTVNSLDQDTYEVVLNVTVTAKHGEKTGFLAEVQQAGVFAIKGFDEAQKSSMLGAYCPNALYPFAREAISDLVVKGGFPQLLLAPINFDALYEQKLRKAAAPAASPEQGAH